MSLIKCKECDKDVSTEAASCPNCGAPVKQEIQKAKPSTIWWVVFLVIIGITYSIWWPELGGIFNDIMELAREIARFAKLTGMAP